ncbi:DUF5682 family protein [Pseudanabaena sp. PCC 6802]|uniref:DUF5682 family protein n=1 Tax=Pseudanabaena sp. PCC 6802 TaxID=118173 RepID=UPI0003474FCF|nr:DUF5682 family protein [Pseudanabaena sp. PCC 6802]
MGIHVFGIRHHGPGSARSLVYALEQLQPDAILVEGPPEAQPILPLLTHADMKPPVALLIYAPEQLQQAVYYPFAIFSPEWQALHYGLTRNIPVRFIDLPQIHRLAIANSQLPTSNSLDPADLPNPSTLESPPDNPERAIAQDPLKYLAEAAGFNDGERWWEYMVEHRRDSTDLFAGILEAMTALRQELDLDPGKELKQELDRENREISQALELPDRSIERQREAYMRQCIRAAQAEGKERIAVVCGAWHAPSLAQMPPAKTDAALLKGLPKIKVEVTWVPWTYGRLCFTSGYGAGIDSPGWYHHLWESSKGLAFVQQSSHQTQELTANAKPLHQPPTPNPQLLSSNPQITTRWIVNVARLLRSQDIDASSASVIEAVRLAESLAALRDRPLPGLPELNEAVQAVLCFGDPLPMQLIREKLIVGERMGEVPDDTPMVPLQQDLLKQQKRLRLKAEASARQLDLDLRNANDLERSQLLHRLLLLDIPWGSQQYTSGKGTFKEQWRLQWQPELAVQLIEASIWGKTIEEAAIARTRDLANRAIDLPTLTDLVDKTLLANLIDAASYLMVRLQAEAAIATDIAHLMAALPPLANVLRYGNVRQIDTEIIKYVVDGLVARICVGLPFACSSLNDEAATAMYDRIVEVNSAVMLLQNPEMLESWQAVLAQMADRQGLHGLLAGRCCRILLDAGIFTTESVGTRMGLALSTASEPAIAAAWVEGFLKGSGLILLHDDRLWQVLDAWVASLTDDTFTILLPLLRRTFSTFPAPERRQMGERVKRGDSSTAITGSSAIDLDRDRADTVLPLVAQLLGVKEL